MSFNLNENSGYLHLDDHGGDGLEFDRADEADLYAREHGMRLQFCKQCFEGSRNVEEADRRRALEEAVEKGEPRPNEETFARERVTTERPQGTINADLAAPAPATPPGQPTRPQTRQTPETNL
jgi:hypothetical protein